MIQDKDGQTRILQVQQMFKRTVHAHKKHCLHTDSGDAQAVLSKLGDEVEQTARSEGQLFSNSDKRSSLLLFGRSGGPK